MEVAVLVYYLSSFLRHLVVAFHDVVAFAAELAHNLGRTFLKGIWIKHLYIDERKLFSYCGHALLKRILGGALGHSRRGFCKAVDTGYILHVHLVDYTLHKLYRALGTSHDSSAQTGHIVLLEVRVIQLCYEHGRDTVDRGALLVVYRYKSLFCIKMLQHDMSCTMGIDCHYTQHNSEAVVQWHRQADTVLGSVLHALAYVVAVVQNVVVGQHDTFWETCSSRCVLHVNYIVFLYCMLCLVKLLVCHMLA